MNSLSPEIVHSILKHLKPRHYLKISCLNKACKQMIYNYDYNNKEIIIINKMINKIPDITDITQLIDIHERRFPKLDIIYKFGSGICHFKGY